NVTIVPGSPAPANTGRLVRPLGGGRPSVRVALLCPYSWSHPGGVQAHVAGLARALARRGVSADIIAPLDGEAGSAGIVRAGRSISVRSNGSVQRVAISPAAALEVARLVRSGR